ncbi:Chromatin modification-related protein [Drosera capensis]
MHGFSSVSTLLINAEVDSMGGVIDGEIGIGTKTSPRRAAIEKAHAELRLEYDVREERRRELEFLERGGNPLDFKFGYPASASVQSTSLSDQQADQILISEAKGSFALTASPPGDSVESSGGPGITVACEPNSADNFDGGNQLLETGRKSRYSRSNITPEHSPQLDGARNVKELGNSPIFHPKRGQAYRRRNRSRTSRDVSRSSSTDIASRGGHTSLLAGRHSTNGKAVSSEDRLNLELVGTNAKDCTSSANATMLEDSPDPSADIGIVGQHTGSIMTHGSLIGTAPEKSDATGGTDLAVSAGICPPATVEIVENHEIHQQQDESMKRKDEGVLLDGIMSSVGFTSKGSDSEFLCSQTSLSVDANGIINRHLKLVDSNGASKGEKVATDETQNVKDDKINGEEDVTVSVESGLCTKDNQKQQSHGFLDEDEKEMCRSKSNVQNDANCSSNAEEMEPLYHAEPSANIKEDSGELPNQILRSSAPQKLQAISDSCKIEPTNTTLSGPSLALELPNSGEKKLQVADKAHEDKILAEARTVEAKRKKLSELSLHSPRTEYRKKSHWDFVVEEMAWLANDFAQERLWKITASAQICHRVALAARLRSIEKAKLGRLRTTARIVANAVMEFWHSAELRLKDDGISYGLERCKPDALAYGNIDEVGVVKERMEAIDKEEPDTDQGVKNPLKKMVPLVQRYAVRFLQYNSSITAMVRAGASETADLEADVSMLDMAWQDHYTEQNLFYLVPPGSMGIYRKSIESSLLCSEKKGINQQDEAEVSMYDTAADFGSQEHDYEEDEAESVTYLPGAFEGSRSLKIVQKKRKTLKSHAARLYGFGGDFTYGNCVENRGGAPQSGSPGKRSMNNVNVGSIPTKRMRTAASRHRTAGSFSMGAAGGTPTPPRNDASSGDTSSFQDDQGMLHGGCMFQQKVSEGESGMEFDKQSIFDPADIPAKPKKKKKFKHQRDQLKKRLPGHQYESNGSTGLYVHHAKKQKLMKQSYENSFENTIPVSGSITSFAASQMSDMSNPNKLSKPAGSQDQVRKVKLPKVTIRQPGSGGEWTLYEDQALVVLVHDMGPNWELVSDAFNSTLLFKGSARQLFRQLQGPLEEDTIKSHFEKITLIGSRLTNRKKQNDNQDLKQVAPVHASHVAALSQAIPNNLNGGVLTPLDLCDVSGPSPDVFPLSSTAAGLASPSQGVIPPTVSSIGNASLQNSPGIGMNMSNNLSPAHPNGSTRYYCGFLFHNFCGGLFVIAIRDGRYGAPRIPFPNDEQHRAQQYNNMLSDRNIQQSNMFVSGNMRVMPGGGMGRMPGMNRGMPMQRPDFQGIASSSMPNSGNMLRMPSTSNMHPGASPDQGNLKLRPGDTVPRPNHSVERRRQMMLPEMPMQVTQANSQGVSAFGGLSSPASIPVQNFPVHQQQQHPVPQHLSPLINPHHPHFQGPTHANSAEQTYRVARQQQQQRMLRRQHQQQQQLQSHFPATSSSMVHGQTQSHVVMSSPLPNNSQIQSPSSSQLVSSPSLPSSSPLTPTSQQQHNHQMSPHSFVLNSQIGMSGVANQIGKQQQRQPTEAHQHQQFQQSGRHQPPQHQQSQSLQQAKRLKGMGRSNMLMHQNAPLDPSHLNGLNQGIEKGEQQKHVIPGHGLYSGSTTLGPPQHSGTSPSRQKQSSSSAPSSAKQLHQMPFHSEDSIQSPVATLPSALGVPTSTQITPPSVMPSHSRQLHGKHQPPVKLVNRGQNAAKRSTQQGHHPRSNQVPKTHCEEAQQEQHLVNNSSPLCVKSETLTTCIESSNQIPTASSASTATVLPTSPRAGAIGSPLNLVPLPADIKGISPAQLPENLPRNSEWQQEQSKMLKQSQQQLEQLPQIQLPQPQQAQRQIKTEENNSIMRPTDSGLG